MYIRNNGSEEQEILQNQFTAYVKRAVHNRRLRYLFQKQRYVQLECSLDEMEPFAFDPHNDIQAFIEMESIRCALGDIKEKERYIILARVLQDKSVGELADELGLSYRAVTSIYYRGMRKLRDILGGGEEM